MEAVLVGAGGHAREILDVVRDLEESGSCPVRIVGVLADGKAEVELLDHIHGVEYLGSLQHAINRGSRMPFLIGIGSSGVREHLGEQLLNAGWSSCPPLIHPSVTMGRGTTVEDGCIAFPNARISTNVTLARHVHVNAGALVAHDTYVGAYSSVNPGAVVSGGAIIGSASTVGANSTVLERLRIGARAVVGAGSVVLQDVPDAQTVVGNPARELARKDEA